MSSETVTILKSELDALVKDQLFYEALRQCGVDNWAGWDEACDVYHRWLEGDENESE